MKLSQQVTYAIDDASVGKLDAALLHACITIDNTSKRCFPTEAKVGRRFVNCIRKYYWIIEPMLGGGVNLVDCRFANIKLNKISAPDLAEFVYEVFRCSHAHGDEVPSVYSILPTAGSQLSNWSFGHGELHMPDRIVWALLAVAVFAKVNAHEKSEGDYYLSLGNDRFPLCDWWGCETDFRPFAERYNQTRVTFQGLDRLEKSGGDPNKDQTEIVMIVQPYWPGSPT
ncbi:MAG: hypothetical protein P4M15_03010 [Alphaproteobacteria bacterium]|nr:hypothetical protein [Alphaproteobacteria bacterium]